LQYNGAAYIFTSTNYKLKLYRIAHIARYLFLSVCILCLSVAASAQQFSINENRKQIKFHFQLVRDMVVIPVFINQKGPFNFVLDTGVGLMVITDPTLVDSININNRRTLKMYGLGNDVVFEAYATSSLDISIAQKLKSQDVSTTIFKEDHFGLSNYAGMPIQGLLGYEFFSNLLVKVNFMDSTLTVVEHDKVKPLKRGTNLHITIEERKPYFKTKILLPGGQHTDRKLLIDLGAGHPLSIENLQPYAGNQKRVIAANLGVGLTGPVNGYISRVAELYIGKYMFKNVITSFPDSNVHVNYIVPRNGNIGMGVLKKFLLVFDYKDQRLYLKPNARFRDPFEHDMSGMEYYAGGSDYKHIIVSRVEPGSAADEAGIKANDEVTAINFKGVQDITIVEVDNLLKSREDRNVLIEIYRNKKFETVVLTLKRRI
jgi:predicted aspartyl protease